MIKKVLVSLALSTLLYSDYYSVVVSDLQNDQKLLFEDGVVVEKHNGSISLLAKQDIASFEDTKESQQYNDVEIEGKIYPVYNLAYLVEHKVKDKEFVLLGRGGKYLMEVEHDTKSLNIMGNSLKADEYEYKIEKAFDKDGNEIEIDEDELLTKFVDPDGNLVALEILDSGRKDLLKVTDNSLEQFLDEKAKRSIKVEKFDFSDQKLYISYVTKKDGALQHLNVTYGMRKGYVKAIMESPLSLFDPQNKSSAIEENIGFLKEYKNDLYEVKKVQTIDKTIDVSWTNSPKKNFVVVNYTTDGQKDKSILSKAIFQQFYGIEGVFYLVSWMAQNGIESKVFTFINGSVPFDVTMKKIAQDQYVMQKNSKTIYKFSVNEKFFITKVDYPSYNLSIDLETIQNDTTIKNIQFLDDYQQQHNIRLIKGDI